MGALPKIKQKPAKKKTQTNTQTAPCLWTTRKATGKLKVKKIIHQR